MAQNTSSAVMQRRVEPHTSLDDFPTPPWATRALLEHVLSPNRTGARSQSCWEPACNRGHMSRPLREYFGVVRTSDIHDYGSPEQDRVADFLFPGSESACIAANGIDWIITNPPFRLASQFIERAFEVSPRVGTAIIVRSAFLEGVGRYEGLFRSRPPSIIAQFTERVVMVKGRLTANGSSATAYSWLVWLEEEPDCRFTWIPPCRRSLQRPEDYSGASG